MKSLSKGRAPLPRANPQLASALRLGYGLQLLSAPQLLPGPPDVERYSCTTNAGCFVLRRFPEAYSLATLQRSLELVEALVGSGFPTAAPLATRHGQTLIDLGPGYAALFHALEGTPPAPSPQAMRLIGRTIGQLHQIGSYEDVATLEDLPPRSALEVRLEALRQQPGTTSAANELLHALAERLSYLDLSAELPSGLLHGSLSLDQLSVDVDGTIYVADGDVFARGPLLLDLALIAAECCLGAGAGLLNLALLAELIEGYSLGARRKVWMHEWQALPLLIYYGTLLLGISQLAAQATSLAQAPDLPAWRTALAMEAQWEQLAARIVELGMEQLAPTRE